MRFEERREGNAVMLTPYGEMDATELPTFAARMDALVQEGVRGIVCDLTHVTLLPSTAAGFLTQAARRLKAAGGRVVLAGASRRVQGTLATMGVLELFPVFEDADAALRAVAG